MDIKEYKEKWEAQHGIITTFNAAVCMVQDFEYQVLLDRQKKYGPENIKEFGEVGIIVRKRDKELRLKNYYFDSNGQIKLTHEHVSDESIDDTFCDDSNYSTIALMVRADVWGLPINKEDNKC